MFKAAGLALAIVASTSPARAETCSGPSDCSYNGRCDDTTNACACFPQFQGTECDVFAFQPLDVEKGVGYKRISDSGVR